MASTIQPQAPPALNIPSSSSTISVSIIDSTCDLVCTARDSVSPVLQGQSYLNMATWVFLLHHEGTDKRLLFDGGCRKDWENLPPSVVSSIHDAIPGLKIEKNINEILVEGGVDAKSIDSIIWSHFHFDHCGDASLFPSTTKIVVGPGFKDELLPGYPTDPEADLLDSQFANRELREISFEESTLTIGGFRAFDFFNDGSLYLLDTPGHCVAHLSALARTTPDTFVLLGGDICDAPQVWRPTEYLPFPAQIPSNVPLDARLPRPCPCALFTACHPEHGKDEYGNLARTTPFGKVSDGEDSLYEEPELAQQSVEKLKVFDADPNVLVCVAHDDGLREVLEFFPHGTVNEWKEKDWKEAAAWTFVNELPVDGKAGKPLKVDGIYQRGERLRSAEDVIPE